MRGHEALIALRLRRRKPVAPVWVVGYRSRVSSSHDWHRYSECMPEVEIGEDENAAVLDLRCMFGLLVMVEALTDRRAIELGQACEAAGADVSMAWSHESERPVFGRACDAWERSQ